MSFKPMKVTKQNLYFSGDKVGDSPCFFNYNLTSQLTELKKVFQKEGVCFVMTTS